MSKGKKKGWIWFGVILALCVLFIFALSGLRQRAAAAVQRASIKSIQAETGTIVKSASGTGTLESKGTMDIMTLTGIKVDEVLVKAGDRITAGQVLATLDRDTLSSMAIEKDQAIRILDAEVFQLSGKMVSQYIYTPVKGRIKQVFADVGDSVSDDMASHQALMIISTDGHMMVQFKPENPVYAGNAVKVKIKDVLYDGTIETATQDLAVAILTDNGPAMNDAAIIMSGDGKDELGEGTLDIHSPLSISAAGGTIKSLLVDENDEVSRNDKIIELEDDRQSSDLAAKILERENAVQAYADILALIQNPSITAEKDGIVSEVFLMDGAYATGETKISGTGSTGSGSSEVAAFRMNLQELVLNVGIDELDMPYVKEGLHATISFDALPDKEYTAVVDRLSSIGTSKSGSAKYSAILKMENSEGLYAGMNATATIEVEKKENIVVIPIEALQEDDTRNGYVYLKSTKPGVLGEKHTVMTGLSDGKLVEITEGLKVGDTVTYKVQVTEGFGMFGGAGRVRNQSDEQAAGE